MIYTEFTTEQLRTIAKGRGLRVKVAKRWLTRQELLDLIAANPDKKFERNYKLEKFVKRIQKVKASI